MGRTLSKKDLQTLEECAFYESGLSANGCLEKLDPYAREAIERYGRYLLKEREKLELEYFKKLKELEKQSQNLKRSKKLKKSKTKLRLRLKLKLKLRLH